MLGDFTILATVAVKDIKAVKEFYSDKLGLTLLHDDRAGLTYGRQDGRLFIYESPTGGTSQATCVTWEVKDIQHVAEDLRNNGVTFEKYDMPGATHEGDVSIMGPYKAAWFKDPSGNIICISEM